MIEDTAGPFICAGNEPEGCTNTADYLVTLHAAETYEYTFCASCVARLRHRSGAVYSVRTWAAIGETS